MKEYAGRGEHIIYYPNHVRQKLSKDILKNEIFQQKYTF